MSPAKAFNFPKIALAPMAGVTDSAFRRIARSFGAQYCVTEMISAKGLCYNDKKTRDLLRFDESERPIAIQLFGSDPDSMSLAARLLLDYKPDVIDINMGCPTPKIVGNGDGSALMKNPKLAAQIVKSVCSESTVPVTVKIRKGWDEKSINAPKFAVALEEAGASGICVHGRTRDQFYAPKADWSIIKAVKEAVKIPVMGNGDIFSPKDAADMMEMTGCDGVMIGRAALGAPWIFSQIARYLKTGELLEAPDVEKRMEIALRHLELMAVSKGENTAVREGRKLMAWYLKGIRNASEYKALAVKMSTLDDARELVKLVVQNNREQ